MEVVGEVMVEVVEEVDVHVIKNFHRWMDSNRDPKKLTDMVRTKHIPETLCQIEPSTLRPVKKEFLKMITYYLSFLLVVCSN